MTFTDISLGLNTTDCINLDFATVVVFITRGNRCDWDTSSALLLALLWSLIQFSWIHVVTDQMNSQYQRENNQVVHSEEALGDSGEEEVFFNRKRTIIEAGSGRGTHRGWSQGDRKKPQTKQPAPWANSSRAPGHLIQPDLKGKLQS